MMIRPRLALLLAACAGLGYAATAVEFAAEPPPPPSSLALAPPAAAAAVAPPPAPAAGPWPEQVARPLFVASRRPPQAAAAPQRAAPPPSPEPPPPQAALGVALRSAGGVMALLRLADGRTLRVGAGEEVEGWRVDRISAEGVDLSRGGRSVTLAARMPAAVGLARAE